VVLLPPQQGVSAKRNNINFVGWFSLNTQSRLVLTVAVFLKVSEVTNILMDMVESQSPGKSGSLAF